MNRCVVRFIHCHDYGSDTRRIIPKTQRYFFIQADPDMAINISPKENGDQFDRVTRLLQLAFLGDHNPNFSLENIQEG